MSRGAVAVILIVGLIVAFFAFGGEAEGPTETPEVNTPSANESAAAVRRFFNNIAEAVSGWNDTTWRIVAVFGAATVLWWVFRKVPMVVWLVIALLGAVIAVQL